MINDSGEWNWFIANFERLSKIDLTAYKRPQMERRINSFMRSAGTADYRSFIALLSSNRDTFNRFVEHITINVSEFFRNTNHWQVLAERIVPHLLETGDGLRIWSAGCSTGEEAYSLAIMAREQGWKLKDKILATDIDAEVLEKARKGVYNEKALQGGISEAYLKKYFKPSGDHYVINDSIKDMVKLQKQDLLKDAFARNFDLILCRNVVIYFTEETKQKLYQKFSGALRKDGILFIGSTEQIFNARDIGLSTIATFFYKKNT